MTTDDKHAKGLALARRLFEGAKGGSRMPEKFTHYTMAHLFGDVWQGEDLALEERSLVTCTILVALNREAEQRLHFLGAKNLGIERSKMEGMITQAAHYAGWPCAASAFRVLNEVWPV
ncbi:MAG: gamma-carboxymuconolactone decarboxylase [Gammaproteobacteria bacterium]|nr:gamma-carboxymuconolactone decarboxylase [Gammaproteobacteria bacterium]